MSSDTPIQTVLQQRDARPVAGEHLEVLGKKAAADWGTGKFASLHEAVIGTVRSEQLSPEQVRRVVEFTNSNAYLNEFRKEGSHKVVHFDNGPADPAQVLQDLNDGGGGTVYDRGTLDYSMPPEHGHKKVAAARATEAMDKTASANDVPAVDLPKLTKMPSLPKLGHALERHDQAFWDLFATSADTVKEASANPQQELVEVQQRLHGTRSELESNLNCFDAEYKEASQALFHQVKQASMQGATLGELVAAWSVVNDDPLFVKAAFSAITPQLRSSGLFGSFDAIGESLMKTAGVGGDVDVTHPAVVAFSDFCIALNKVASTRILLGEVTAAAGEADMALKLAAGGIIGGAKAVVKGTSKAIDKASPHVARALVGADGAKKLAPRLAMGMKGTAAVGGVLAGNAAVQNVTDRPAVRGVASAVKSTVPGTMEYQQRRYNNMTGQ